MKNFMKKTVSIILTLTMVCSLGILSVGASEVDTDAAEIDLEMTEEELEAFRQRDAGLLADIEANIDEIHAEADEYQRTAPQTRGYNYDYFVYLDGDILVTKSTSSGGFTGHCGIVVGDKILEATPAYNGGVPTPISFETWYERYPETITIRYKIENRNVPVDAAWEGQTFYIDGEGADNTYALPSDIYSETKYYCSSLVWKCFYRGADFKFQIYLDTPSGSVGWTDPTFGNPISPYDYVSCAKYNEFKAVNYVNW